MLSDTLRTRAVIFAFLFGPPRFIRRDEASELYGAVCDALNVEDLTFRYSTAEPATRASSIGFSISLARKEGRGEYSVIVDQPNAEMPIRLLMQYAWPPSLEHVVEYFDMTAQAVFDKLAGPWQKVLAEARTQAEVHPSGENGLSFLKRRVFCLRDDWYQTLGTGLSMAGVKFEVHPGRPDQGDSLSNPGRDLMMEVLRQTPAGLYLELKSMWPQMPQAMDGTVPFDLSAIREIDKKPSEYVSESNQYLRDVLDALDQERENRA